MRVLTGHATTVWVSKDELLDAAAAPDQIAAAHAALERAESRGFLYCQAVFIDGRYDGLHEKAHPTDGRLDWGRGQNVTERNFFRDGVLVRDPEWPGVPREAEWESHGFQCHIIMHPSLGHRCGYVGVPKGHPWFGIDYDGCTLGTECPNIALRESEPDGYHSCYDHSPNGLVEVHGGLTYAASDDEGWWYFGFDFAHSGDAPSPEVVAKNVRSMGSIMSHEGDHYWTLPEVTAEAERLAEQLSRLT